MLIDIVGSFELSEVQLKHIRLQEDVREIHKKVADQKTKKNQREEKGFPLGDNPPSTRGTILHCKFCDRQHAPNKIAEGIWPGAALL